LGGGGGQNLKIGNKNQTKTKKKKGAEEGEQTRSVKGWEKSDGDTNWIKNRSRGKDRGEKGRKRKKVPSKKGQLKR